MAISLLCTGVAIAIVFAAVGWRMMRHGNAVLPPVEATLALPANAHVVATSVSGDRMLLTVEVDGRTEIHILDAATLQRRCRLQITTGP
jgi:hypothetical protein